MSHPHHPAELFDKKEIDDKKKLIVEAKSERCGEENKDDNDDDIVILTRRPNKGTLYKCPKSPQQGCEAKLSKYSQKEAPPEQKFWT